MQSSPLFTVNSNADTSDGLCLSILGGCTLREAIAAASAGDFIQFDSSLSGGTIALGSTLTLSKNLTIDGAGLAVPVTLSGDTNGDGTGDVRLFVINTGYSVTLNNLVITKGYTTSGGGAIYNNGTLTVVNCTFSNNIAASGGAIYNVSGSTLLVTGCNFTGNSTSGPTGWGGAIHNRATAAVANSTFSGNTTYAGGAFVNYGGVANLANVTISGNTASFGGGIINYSGGLLTLTNATLSANTATSTGGGIYNGSSLSLANTILANSTSGGDCSNAGTISSQAYNLIEASGSSACGIANGSNGSIVGVDPALGALQENGGGTPTHALGSSSRAIDAGDAATCAAVPVSGADQRGQARSDYQCDIGAFELKMADSSTVIKTVSGAGAYTFGPTMVKILVNSTGACLSGLTVQRYDEHHPSATTPLQTGHWWEITPAGCTSGFNANLTLPTDFLPTANDKLCRWIPGTGWECAMSTFSRHEHHPGRRDRLLAVDGWTAGRPHQYQAGLLQGGLPRRMDRRRCAALAARGCAGGGHPLPPRQAALSKKRDAGRMPRISFFIQVGTISQACRGRWGF